MTTNQKLREALANLVNRNFHYTSRFVDGGQISLGDILMARQALALPDDSAPADAMPPHHQSEKELFIAEMKSAGWPDRMFADDLRGPEQDQRDAAFFAWSLANKRAAAAVAQFEPVGWECWTLSGWVNCSEDHALKWKHAGFRKVRQVFV